MACRYECKLSPEVLKKAVDELNEPEDNSKRLAAIDRLRKKFTEDAKDLELIRSDDAFLLRFLRVRKFDEDRAFDTLRNYHMKRKESPEVFELVDNPKVLENFIHSGALVPLREGRAKDGTFVIAAKLGRGYSDSGDFVKFIALCVLSLEKLLEKEEVQIFGFTLINDPSELALSYVPFMATYAKTMSSLMQDAMPVRLKSFNLVNESRIIDVLYAIITKFMKEKMKNRIQLHGNDFKTLHEKVDPRFLPFALGGTGPDLDGEWWAQQVISSVGAGEGTNM